MVDTRKTGNKINKQKLDDMEQELENSDSEGE